MRPFQLYVSEVCGYAQSAAGDGHTARQSRKLWHFRAASPPN